MGLCFGLFLPPGSTPTKNAAARADQDHEEQPWLYCRTCRQPIVQQSARISIQGKHEHVFFNPAGLVFEIGCFAHAPGCVRQGEPSTDFTWFPGYAWNFSLCMCCHAHLGWWYATDQDGFFGLILAQLAGPA
ncbi:hypothetical protein MASR1M90_19160 [Desulfovibrionales bacterium]